MEQAAMKDGLTGLYNRRYFNDCGQQLFSDNRGNMAVLMIDIDHFKSVNDQYGRLVGDEVLKEVCQAVLSSVRSNDSVFRYGGEEVVALLPSTAYEEALHLAERIRKNIESLGLYLHVTVSIGAAVGPYDASDFKLLLDQADQALYASKQNGSNRVTAYRHIREHVTDGDGILQHPPLVISEEKFGYHARALFEFNPDVVWWADITGKVLSVNSRVTDVFGYAKNEFISQTLGRFFPFDLDNVAAYFLLAKKGKPQNFETVFLHKLGYELALNITFVPVTVDYKIVGVYGIAKDISERKKIEAALMESHEFIAAILDSITDGFIAVDSDWKITYWNNEAKRIINEKSDDPHGAVLWNVFPSVVETSIFTKLHKALYEKVSVQFEVYHSLFDKWYSFHAYPYKNGLSIYFHDITQRKKAEEKIAHITYYDILTGLPNQKLFKERLNQGMVRSERNNEELFVLLIDLDRFRLVNDSLGYENGNRVLTAAAKRLAACLRDEDIVARYEGDKFAVLLRKITRIKVEQIAMNIFQQFQKPHIVDRHEIVVTPSIGIGVFPKDAAHSEDLIAKADTALRRSKIIGSNRWKFYTAEMNNGFSLSMERDLHKALERNELLLYYQPQIEIRTGKIVGLEALIRWRHPKRGMIAPAEFIPLAEETGLIIPIGKWVLKQACIQNRAWQEAGITPVVVSVNLSALQFSQGDIAEDVRHILEETGLEPNYLDLEITESMMIDVDRAISILNGLKQLGVSITMDDFGKGYSSLYYLKRFPLNTLKIDQSFVRDCTADSNDATIVKTIISMAHSLNLNVIAEGVETKEQLVFLQQHYCNEAQGYLFSYPMLPDELELKFAAIEDKLNRHGLSIEHTERMWVEEQLRLARQDLEDTVRKQMGIIFKFEKRNGRFFHTLCDGELLHRLDLVSEQIIGKQLHEFVSPDIAEQAHRHYQRAWDGDADITFEFEISGIWLLSSLRPVQRGGKVVEVIGSSVEITERKRAEQELKATKEKLESFIQNNFDAISIVDLSFRITRVNDAFVNMFGWSQEELVDQIVPTIPQHLEEEVKGLWQNVIAGGVVTDFETVRCRKDGSLVDISMTLSLIRDEESRPSAVSAIMRDITERKQAEELFHKSERLAAVGELAAGIAHEIRNPITAIKGFVTLLQRNNWKPEYFDTIFKEFKGLEAKVDELLILAKPQAVNYQAVDLVELLQNVVILLEGQAILHNIQIQFEEAAGIPEITGDKNQLKQVFINLFKNAIESMPEGGQLAIQCKAPKTGQVLVTVTDSGCGISKERLGKLGEPYYSNKEKGTGLGLTICFKIIKEHGGLIQFTSELNQGTVVDVWLPVK